MPKHTITPTYVVQALINRISTIVVRTLAQYIHKLIPLDALPYRVGSPDNCTTRGNVQDSTGHCPNILTACGTGKQQAPRRHNAETETYLGLDEIVG